MQQIINQPFNGVINSIRIDGNNGNGQIIPIIDWATIATKHTPINAKNIQFQFILEYLTMSYYLPTLLRIPSTSYPEYKAADKELQRALKTVEFKRSFSPDKNYAVQFLLWHRYGVNWNKIHFERDQLQNAGMEGRINLIKPYLCTAGDTVYGDSQYKLGLSIAPRYLQEGDYLEISGGYSGSVSYIYEAPEIKLNANASGSVKILDTVTQIVDSVSTRARASLYLSNAGNKRIYWSFTNNSNSLIAGQAPFLEPGESLTVEHGELFYSGENEHLINRKNIKYMINLPLYGIVESGIGSACYQEFVFPFI